MTKHERSYSRHIANGADGAQVAARRGQQVVDGGEDGNGAHVDGHGGARDGQPQAQEDHQAGQRVSRARQSLLHRSFPSRAGQ